MSNANVTRLNAAIEKIDALERDLATYREKTHKRLQVLRIENELITNKLAVASERITFLERYLELEEDDEEQGGPAPAPALAGGHANGGEPTGENAAPGTDVDRQLALSAEAAKGKPMKDLIAKIFKHLMGVSKITPKCLPAYPSADTPPPQDPSTGQPLLRLNWNAGASHVNNVQGLERVLTFIRTHGARHHPIATQALTDINDDDLKERIKSKYEYMARQWRLLQKGVVVPAEDEEDDPFAEEAPAGSNDAPATAGSSSKGIGLLRSQQNSRAISKLEGRKRKRVGSDYVEPKFDAAFTLNAMSADEDDPEQVSGEARQWRSRAPDFRSDLAQELYNTIDAIPDPDPDKSKAATTRVRGPVQVSAVPAKAKSLKNRLRAWQIKPEVLAENPHWLTSKRVARSGKAWGDTEDPTDDEETRREAGKNKRATKRPRRATIDKAGVNQSEARLKALTGGRMW
ncbi:hypothetical protein B0H21DRAFT_822396 [Amylocystis lapponica]|nr:hypothetical protein B0H21DRAFT_822396 [Amylocystis lapponica]